MTRQLLAFLLIALVAATLAGFAGEYAWFLELFVHFRVHYLAGALLLTLACMAARNPVGIAVGLLCLILNGSAVFAFFTETPAPGPTPRETLKLVSANIGGSVRDNSTRIGAFIREERADVLLLIELTPAVLAKLEGVLDEIYPHRYALPRSDYFGIGLFSRRPLLEPTLLDLGYRNVPAISVRVQGAREVRIVGVHLEWPLTPASAAGRNTQLENLALRLQKAASGEATVLLGDLNLTRWSSRFGALTRATGLRDAAAGFGWQPTWPTFLPRIGIAIDHCLASPSLGIRELRAGPDIGADHYPLMVELNL